MTVLSPFGERSLTLVAAEFDDQGPGGTWPTGPEGTASIRLGD